MMPKKDIRAIVAGGLHTDLFFEGVEDLVAADRASVAKNIKIAGGGKSVNIARMMAQFLPEKTVAMLGRTTRDPFNLWRPPMQSLQEAGVVANHISISAFDGTFPAVAIVQSDSKGNNASCLCRGIDDKFLPADIKKAERLFAAVAENKGIYITSLEAPLVTVRAGINMARKYGLKIMIEPGGITDPDRIRKELFGKHIYLIKPNEHEAEVLSGQVVRNFSSARKAAEIILQRGVQYVLITAGKRGAYLFSENIQKHIPIPVIKKSHKEFDSNGCGDQVLATLVALLLQDKTVEEAAAIAIRAGTMQFHKKGIVPITKKELFGKR